jgi:hypothetical protein
MRSYYAGVFETQVFGAFSLALEYRKELEGVTQKSVADGIGKSEDNVSKLFSKPRNWQLKTISDLCYALDLTFEFVLIDRHEPSRLFTATGVTYNVAPANMFYFGQQPTYPSAQFSGYWPSQLFIGGMAQSNSLLTSAHSMLEGESRFAAQPALQRIVSPLVKGAS